MVDAGETQNAVATENMNFESSSSSERLDELVKRIVCGKLRGELPDGFLSVMKDLPDELLMKICEYSEERLFMRLVCKRWLHLWERCRENKLVVESVRLQRIAGGKLKMSVNVGQVWGSRSRDYECVNNPEVVRRILSLVSLRKEAPYYHEIYWPLLVLSDGMTDPSLLKIISSQNWEPSAIVLTGQHDILSEKQLLEFLTNQRFAGKAGHCIVIQHPFVAEKFSVDKLIELSKGLVEELVLFKSASAPPGSSAVEVTDRGLHDFAEYGRCIYFPSNKNVSLSGIQDFIKCKSSIFHVFLQRRLKENECDYAGELCTTVSDVINATNIAKLSPSFDGVELKVEYRHGEEQYGSVDSVKAAGTGVIVYSCARDLLLVRIMSVQDYSEKVANYRKMSVPTNHSWIISDSEIDSLGDGDEFDYNGVSDYDFSFDYDYDYDYEYEESEHYGEMVSSD
ncbi:unnamed protein product [Enterobius vermicularis]|uniref:F-box domain-containing protein n=1 Tax=Enterobius vermicularis TaxID=51028 RepID=A0A158Q9Z7_ENTVE|nr:unnamed protein product [Enterobius vermicularis]